MCRDFSIGFATVVLTAAAVLLVGCAPDPAPPAAAVRNAAKPEGEHGHADGAHGGIIVSIGRDAYHAEAVFDRDGSLALFMLGSDETEVREIELQTLTAFAKADGDTSAVKFSLEPAPQTGDAPGATSQFVGKLPAELVGKNVQVTIPVIRIGGERYRIGFQAAGEKHAETAQEMPEMVSNQEERDLFLTPGGLYTDEDIAANGRMTVTEKFKGFKPAHDLNPKAGDKICPITLTKSNPKCSWVIGGKEYEFCCPPCVVDFVQLAKKNPEQVKAPESYVK